MPAMINPEDDREYEGNNLVSPVEDNHTLSAIANPTRMAPASQTTRSLGTASNAHHGPVQTILDAVHAKRNRGEGFPAATISTGTFVYSLTFLISR